MREYSCRTCGPTMKEFQRCSVCNKVIRFICTKCRKSSDEQVHMDCGIFRKEVILN